jgi:hypothetical protein
VVEVAAPKQATKQGGVQNAKQEQEKEDNQLQVYDIREGLDQRHDRNFQALVARNHSQGAEYTQDSQGLKDLQVLACVGV